MPYAKSGKGKNMETIRLQDRQNNYRTFTKISDNQAKKIFDVIRYCNKSSLYDVYASFSRRKVQAMQFCKELQLDFGGFCGAILGANCFTFSYGFIFEYDSKTYVCKITKSNIYVGVVNNGK